MGTPVDGFKDLLVAGGAGVFASTSGWSICIGKLVDAPDTCVSIRQTGGLPANPKWLLDYPSLQVIVRGAPSGYQAALIEAYKVKDVLLGLTSLTLNGDRWVSVLMVGDITDLGQDILLRPRFSLNFSCIIEPASNVDTHRQSLPA